MDINLIQDEANVMYPNSGPRPEVLQLGEKFAAMVEQAQGDNQATSEPTDPPD